MQDHSETEIDGEQLQQLLAKAWASRRGLLGDLERGGGDCYRIFHGVAEGMPGVSVDRYGSQILIQSFHHSLTPSQISNIDSFFRAKFASIDQLIYHDRSANSSRRISNDTYVASEPLEGSELGVVYQVDVKRLGQDPLLFLDMRVGRQWMLKNARGKSVLNLFAYTCGIGICAAKAGAEKVWNVDFSESALEVGQANALLNGLDLEAIRFIQSDCFPALKQLAGIPIRARQRRLRNGRVSKTPLPNYPVLPKKQFDVVFMDPPRWAKSAFGTVDLLRDYQSLFKPALMATKPGGQMVVCNNVAKVDRDLWISQLVRCAEKMGRQLKVEEMLQPYDDFPSFDDNPPLKIAVLRV